MFKIFIVEDNENIRTLVSEYLEKYNYTVIAVDNFKDIERQFEAASPHLVILDINLPYYDGFYLCKSIRRKSNIPIIILSARSGETEQIMGIELGADDYITKPFNTEILMSKIKAALRRVYGDYSTKELILSVNGLLLNETNFKMMYKELSIELSKNEFKLIKKLMNNCDKIVSREELLAELWDEDLFVDDNTLTVNVTRLKNKFNEIGINNAIKTKRGLGYILDSTVITEDVP